MVASAITLGADTVGKTNATLPAIYVVNSASAPTFAAAQGSIALNQAGSGIANRMWVNSTGSTTWVAVSTVS
jgi:hypothetical protein